MRFMRFAPGLLVSTILALGAMQAQAIEIPASCGTFGTATKIGHTQTTNATEEVFRCDFDPGHSAITRQYEITNDTGRGWLSYLFEVDVDPETQLFNWTKNHILPDLGPTLFSPNVAALTIVGRQARVEFQSLLADGEKFLVELRFGDYRNGTAIVNGTPTVPEPATLPLVGLALLGAIGLRRASRPLALLHRRRR